MVSRSAESGSGHSAPAYRPNRSPPIRIFPARAPNCRIAFSPSQHLGVASSSGALVQHRQCVRALTQVRRPRPHGQGRVRRSSCRDPALPVASNCAEGTPIRSVDAQPGRSSHRSRFFLFQVLIRRRANTQPSRVSSRYGEKMGGRGEKLGRVA